MMNCRADLYHRLAEALYEPPDWLALPGSAWPLFASLQGFAEHSPAARRALIDLAEIPAESLDLRKKRYRVLAAAGNGKPEICFYESLHRRGRLAGPEAFEVARRYREVGLEPDPSDLPDHAAFEMAFLSVLAASSRHAAKPSRKEARFLADHAADWLIHLGRRLERFGDPVYAPIGRLLAGVLMELTRKPRSGGGRHHLPVLQLAERCSLCGFCAQVCPTGALVVRENESETSLVLNPSRCTGCEKCARRCDSGALALTDPGSGILHDEARPLFRSPRVPCPRCGVPTVSQAEMGYMNEVLGPQAWLNLCLDCRTPMSEIKQ